MKNAFAISVSIFLFFQNSSAAEPKFASCVDSLAKQFSESTQLGISETKITDYGFSKYTNYSFTKYINRDIYFYEATSRGKSAQMYQFEAKNAHTSFSFNFKVRLYTSEYSEFGSGRVDTVSGCCISQSSVTIKDLKTDRMKDFSVDFENNCQYNDVRRSESFSNFKEITPNQCAKYGKKKRSWNSSKKWSYQDEFDYDCSRERDGWREEKTCTHKSEYAHMDQFYNVGCKLNSNHPDDVSDFDWGDERYVPSHPYYKPGDAITPNGKILRGYDKVRRDLWREDKKKKP